MAMKGIRLLFAALVAALSLVVLVPSTSYACSCKTSSPQGYVDWADVVLDGTVVHRAPPPQKAVMSSGDPATYTVTVDRVLKGQAHATTQVLSADAGMSCGLERIRIGRRYLVFANQSDGRLWANLCGGTAPATPRFLAEVTTLTGPGAPPSANGAVLPRFTTDQMPDDTWDPDRPQGLAGWLTTERVMLLLAGGTGLALVAAAAVLVVRHNR